MPTPCMPCWSPLHVFAMRRPGLRRPLQTLRRTHYVSKVTLGSEPRQDLVSQLVPPVAEGNTTER